MAHHSIRTDLPKNIPYGPEHDACALYLSARKNGQSTFGTLKRALWRLSNMGHRTGYVNGEGDGAGVQTDIPRGLWAKKISKAGLPASLATQPGFWVGHLIIPFGINFSSIEEKINQIFSNEELNLLVAIPAPVRVEALGLNAQFEAPSFWQLAGKAGLEDFEKRLFSAKLKLDEQLPVHFASLSSYTVVYKMRGSVETLARYFPELQDRSYDTIMALCHARYSTNTVSNFERSQPFALLGHNGEINTINQFRRESKQIGVRFPKNGSDSQDVDRTLEFLCVEHGMSLMEAMEVVFPPTPHEIDGLSDPAKDSYNRLTQSFGPFAQGPAAIGARYADTAVCSLDPLGLRPLWFSETEKEYIFSSERGAIMLEDMVADSRPLAPGEKMGLTIKRGQGIEVHTHENIRQNVVSTILERSVLSTDNSYSSPVLIQANPSGDAETGVTTSSAFGHSFPWQSTETRSAINDKLLASAGWTAKHVSSIREQAKNGKDPVGSMGYDGPLASLSKTRVNIADHFKETVAVVTNPAIDRGREYEAFSTRSIVGMRPRIFSYGNQDENCAVLDTPLLSGGLFPQNAIETPEDDSGQSRITRIEDLLSNFKGQVAFLPLAIPEDLSMQEALEQLAQTAITAVEEGVNCLVLDDTEAFSKKLKCLDPLLATAAVDNALSDFIGKNSLRRKSGIVVRSASIRDLHDIILLCSFGADAINPYAMLFTACSQPAEPDKIQNSVSVCQGNLLHSLQTGMEKVISTIGCHELRGYGRVCSSIGLSPEIAAIFQSPNYLGSSQSGLNWEFLEKDAASRREELHGKSPVKLAKESSFYPKLIKTISAFVTGQNDYEKISEKYTQLMADSPISLRHIVHFKPCDPAKHPKKVDISIKDKRLPFVISAMSFGSQGKLSYKAYAQAAKELNMICINGEGGELPELLGKYKNNRGQQVASGRFGVNAALLNSSRYIEIKIGQGAKPGEGGMLPAEKVNPDVAQARHTPPYIPLLSPSNNHDLYSIEDLAQLIEELRTVSPDAKISVKCPCVPGIGVIAVGIAKAGADIINLSGYDGATGAARMHSIKNVGLPAEIGVTQAHRALVTAGIREKVEIWCDGGMKTGDDVVKMVLLGANRIGFGSMAMIAIGCTYCRKCNEGTCHMGITTHIRTLDEAREAGLKNFTPLDFQTSVKRLIRLFNGIGREVSKLTGKLGAEKLQDLVGRSDLLEQTAYQNRIDLSAMLEPAPVIDRKIREPGVGRLLTRDRNQLTRFISESILSAVNDGEKEVTYQDQVMAYDRALGSHLYGALTRQPEIANSIEQLHIHFSPSSIGGNGFAAWSTEQTDILIEGGAQDGVAKGACGGRVAIMKGLNHDGLRIDGSVGKSFAYGAQKGLLIVQGNADSRACIRLSGADVIFGGEIIQPLNGTSNIGSTANLKGFACEYMTSGRVIILGDPGPYAFSGMTGGVVYQLLSPEMGFTITVLESRFAIGACVETGKIKDHDLDAIQELLGKYRTALTQTNQYETADKISKLSLPQVVLSRFVKVVPMELIS